MDQVQADVAGKSNDRDDVDVDATIESASPESDTIAAPGVVRETTEGVDVSRIDEGSPINETLPAFDSLNEDGTITELEEQFDDDLGGDYGSDDQATFGYGVTGSEDDAGGGLGWRSQPR